MSSFRFLGEPWVARWMGRSLGTPALTGDDLYFLLRDDFIGGDAGTPRTCTPGPGTLTTVATDGTPSISGGRYVFPVQATPTWGDQGYYDNAARTREAGLTSLLTLNLSTWEECGYGWHTAQALVDPDNMEHAIQANTTDGRLDLQGGLQLATGLSTSTDYPLYCILRDLGAYWVLKDGNDYRLLWVDDAGDTATLYPQWTNLDGIGTQDTIRVARLPGSAGDAVPGNNVEEWGHRDLDQTSASAAPVAGNTFTHTPDFTAKMTITTMAAAGQNIWWHFRMSAAGVTNPSLNLRISDTGVVRLYDYDGSYTLIGIAGAGTVALGDDVEVVAVDDNVKVFVDNDATAVIDATSTIDVTGTVAYLFTLASGVVANFALRTLDGPNVGSSNFVGYGIATAVLPGPRAAADTFTHEADCVIEFELVALPGGADVVDVEFRRQDATHHWTIRINAAGDLILIEDNAGETARITDAGVLAGGERIVCVADDDDITLYYDTTQAGTYASATNFKTLTSGEIEALGAAGQVSNLISSPRNLAAAPNTPGANNARNALVRMAD